MSASLRGRAALAVLALGAALVSAPRVAPAQDSALVLRHAGVTRAGELMRRTLSRPYRLIPPGDTAAAALPRDSTESRTVVVLGHDVTVASTVHGDVVVIGGDLFLHPGASVDGDVIAFGGGIYNSSLATVRGHKYSFLDETFDYRSRDGRWMLAYHALELNPLRTVTLPMYGFRIPEYTRVDGLVLPWGPRVAFDTGRIQLEPLVTYRSDLGEVDPSLTARAQIGRMGWAEVRGARETRSNDRWIRSNLINSLLVLGHGHDYRNYYRADRAEARVGKRWETPTTAYGVWGGGLTERAWSVRAGGPWSFLQRKDIEAMYRPNPSVRPGRISSAVAGGNLSWTSQQVSVTSTAEVEGAFSAPDSRRFTQTTLDVTLGLPTFGTHTIDLMVHSVGTLGDAAPPQRFAYLGGSGTIPTLDEMSRGGDQLLLIQAQYNVPLTRPRVPIVGPPTISLLYIVGGAGVGRLGELDQNVGPQVTLRPLQVSFVIDPATRKTKLNVGLSISR